MRHALLALAVLALFVVPANAAIISGNYCSVASIVDYGGGVGAAPAQLWNDFTGPAGFSPTDSFSNPIYDDGTPATGTVIEWVTTAGGSQNSNDNITRPTPPASLGGDIDDGHDQMMAGYIQASKYSDFDPVITLEATGLDTSAFGGDYSVLVYMDGDADVASDDGHVAFEIWSSEQSYLDGDPAELTYYGQDFTDVQYTLLNDGSDPMSVYEPFDSTDELNPAAGNYVRFDGLQGDEFYIRMTGMAQQHGVAMNGFQIVPEPSTLALLVFAAGPALLRRR